MAAGETRIGICIGVGGADSQNNVSSALLGPRCQLDSPLVAPSSLAPSNFVYASKAAAKLDAVGETEAPPAVVKA